MFLHKYEVPLRIGIMAIALLLGLWLALSPSIVKRQVLEWQNELLKSITENDGLIVLDEGFYDLELDFYDDDVADSVASPESATAPELASAELDTVITGIGILTIEKIDLKLPVVDGVSSAQLKVAVGRVPETAGIGETGNAVIAGHRSYTHGQYFNRLGELESGDIIRYQSKEGEQMTFEVYDISQIEPGEQSAFAQPLDTAEITLYTCTPIRIATHRLLVRARRTK